MRPDMETAIMAAWQTSEDLDLFFRHHGDHPVVMTEDQVANMLLGLKNLHDMRMEQLWDVYKFNNKLDEYCDDEEKLAARKWLAGAYEEIDIPKKKGKKK